MANRIRGITIEIGGDTTKLDKALAVTNKEIKTTQAALKDVQRLLKMDPGNTTLLEQKQRLLSQAVSETKTKLDTLRDAAKNADEALARGKAYEEKYAPLKASITEVSGQLDKLRKQQDAMDDGFATGTVSDEAYAQFNNTLKEAEAQFSSLKQAKKDLDAEFDGWKLDQSQYDALQQELAESEQNYKDLTKQAERCNVSLESFGAKADEISNKTKGLSVAAAGAATGMIGMAVAAGKSADDLNTLSKQSGFSTETIQKWQYASDVIDVSVDDIIGAARKMEKNMGSTSTSVTDAWNRLGISVRDGSGNLREAEDVFNELIDRLADIPSETDRDVLAMTLLGKSANDLAGLIDDGGAALRKLGQEAQDSGLILSQDALDGANAFNDALDRMKATLSADFLKAGAQLADSLTPVIESLANLVMSLVGWFSDLSPGMQKMILYAALMLAGISPISKSISNVTSAISGINNVAKLFTNGAGNKVYVTFAKWAVIIAAVALAIAGLIAMINILMGKGDQVSATLGALNGRSPNVGGSRSGSGTAAMTASVPGFASGGVFAPNSPMLAVLGDNRTEYEVAAPESALRETFLDALASSGLVGGGGNQSSGPGIVNLQIDGYTFARLFLPYLKNETYRVGPDILNR